MISITWAASASLTLSYRQISYQKQRDISRSAIIPGALQPRESTVAGALTGRARGSAAGPRLLPVLKLSYGTETEKQLMSDDLACVYESKDLIC